MRLCILKVYGDASGQQINFAKSGVQYLANVDLVTQLQLGRVLGVPPVQDGAKDLGLPSCWGRTKFEAFNFLIERVLSKLQGWKAHLLSQGGKETLIKSVAHAISTYVMACFMFSNKVCDKLNSLIRNFL